MSAIAMHGKTSVPARESTRKKTETGLIFTTAFVFFFVAALVGRLLPERQHSGFGGAGPHASLVREAKAKAYSLLSFTFMG